MKIKLNYVIAILLLGVVLLGANMASDPSNKLGHLDSGIILSMLPEVDTVEMQLKTIETENTKQMEIMYADYQQKLSDVQNMDPSTPESIQNLRYQELVDLEKRIRNFQTESQRDLENAQVKLLQPILDKVEGAIDRVAEQYHYDYIFDTRYGTILHQNPSKDVIELVKKELGLEGVPTPDPEAESGEENPIETR